MGKTVSIAGWLLGLAFGLAACSGSSKSTPSESKACTEGARICEGLNVRVCGADGNQEIVETCRPQQSCADGACVNTACVPNTRFCRGGQIYKCDSQGAGSSLHETCGSDEFCLEDDDDAECSDTACAADEPMCSGAIATVCKPDGSGPKPGGDDCAKADQVCYQGTCRARACEPGVKLCQDGDVFLCSENGSSMVLLADCLPEEVCDDTRGTCRLRVCEPGKLGCDGTRVVACNEYGSGWEQSGQDCMATNEVCVAGSCKKQTCTPNTDFCKDNDVYRCDSTGLTSTLNTQCNPTYFHCESHSGAYASCTYNECHAGQLACDGDYIKLCTDSGTFPPTGTYCGENKFCENGTCKDRECEAYTYLCKDGDIYYCDYFGANSVAEDCIDGAVCSVVDGGPACVARPCQEGEKSCLGNKLGICAAEGFALSTVTEDCAATGKVCGEGLTCEASIEDTLGVAEDVEVVSPGYIVGNSIEVHSARSLVEIEANLVLATERTLRWVVFEQVESSFIARFDKVTSNQTGAGFISSGPISYSLKAGKRYLIGVVITGANGIAYIDAKPWNHHLSFGTLLGRTTSYYSPSIGVDYFFQEYLYQLRVTTQAPP